MYLIPDAYLNFFYYYRLFILYDNFFTLFTRHYLLYMIKNFIFEQKSHNDCQLLRKRSTLKKKKIRKKLKAYF